MNIKNDKKMVLASDLFFESKFYTIDDVVRKRCGDIVLDFVKKFTDDILDDLTGYEEDYMFRLIVQSDSGLDFAEVKLVIYEVVEDVHYGLEAEARNSYYEVKVSLDEVQMLLKSIQLPKPINGITSEPEGLKEKEKVYYEDDVVIDYAREYEPLDCDCYPGCNCEPRWTYDYTRPIGARAIEREYIEKYLVLDLEEYEAEDDEIED